MITAGFGGGGGGGCNFNFSFKLARVETREDPNTTISGPSSARQRSPIYMAFRWRADDGPTLKIVSEYEGCPGSFVILFRGSQPVLLGNPILLWFLVGVGVGGLLVIKAELRRLIHVFVYYCLDK